MTDYAVKDSITEKLSADSFAPSIWIRTEDLKGRTVAIRVIDNGSRMSKITQKQIFDPFFKTKPIGKGTVLGHSISYQIIVERHQGTLECRSKLGQGVLGANHHNAAPVEGSRDFEN